MYHVMLLFQISKILDALKSWNLAINCLESCQIAKIYYFIYLFISTVSTSQAKTLHGGGGGGGGGGIFAITID